jgi:hypothetical protein
VQLVLGKIDLSIFIHFSPTPALHPRGGEARKSNTLDNKGIINELKIEPKSGDYLPIGTLF